MLLKIPLGASSDRCLLRGLLGNEGGPRLLALCEAERKDVQYEALCLGALALLHWDSPMEYIVSAILRIRRGEVPIEYCLMGNPGLASQVRRRLWELSDRWAQDLPDCRLSDRELAIMSSVAAGQTNKEIGRDLGVNEQTVKNYMSIILKTLDARDRAHAVTLALSYGWISPLR